jgi:hypothetical protein
MSTAPVCFVFPALLLWPKWHRPRRWCGSRRRLLVGLLEKKVKDLIAF